MNSRLEQFVRDHREEFDGEEPDNKIWEKIRNEVTPSKKKTGGPGSARPGRLGGRRRRRPRGGGFGMVF